MNSEPRLHEAFDRYVQQQDQQLPTEQELESVTLSEGLNKRMEKLLRRESRGYYVLFGTAARRFASVAAVFIILAAAATTGIETVRNGVSGFLTKVFDTDKFVWTDPDVPIDTVLTKRIPTNIPRGYTMIRHEDYGEVYMWRYWSAVDDSTIVYTQSAGDMSVPVDTEGAVCTEVSVGERTGLTYMTDEKTTLIVKDEESTYVFTTDGEPEEVLRMAHSLDERGEQP